MQTIKLVFIFAALLLSFSIYATECDSMYKIGATSAHTCVADSGEAWFDYGDTIVMNSGQDCEDPMYPGQVLKKFSCKIRCTCDYGGSATNTCSQQGYMEPMSATYCKSMGLVHKRDPELTDTGLEFCIDPNLANKDQICADEIYMSGDLNSICGSVCNSLAPDSSELSYNVSCCEQPE